MFASYVWFSNFIFVWKILSAKHSEGIIYRGFHVRHYIHYPLRPFLELMLLSHCTSDLIWQYGSQCTTHVLNDIKFPNKGTRWLVEINTQN
jgi:hypothetical protein